MELVGQGSYRQLAEEIGAVLQSAADTAEKMQEEARAEAGRIRDEAEAELRNACAEGRRIVEEARMEADMQRAEAQWQAQELLAQARRQGAEHLAGADARRVELELTEGRVLERLAAVGQMVAAAIAELRERPAPAATEIPEQPVAGTGAVDAPAAETGDGDPDEPSAKVYFVEFPPPAAPAGAPDPPAEIVLPENSGASLFASDQERSEWAPPVEQPTWWTRGGAQS